MQAIIIFGNKVNAITLGYISKLKLKIYFINVKIEKIDKYNLKTFEMVLFSIQVKIKLIKIRFFQKTFLFANFSKKVILKMVFLILRNANIE